LNDPSATPAAANDAAPNATPTPAMTRRERFRKACRLEPLDYPPTWLMRQAGRCLPEYRALKEKHSFVEIAQTPELATEVTLQPIRRFDYDAAILFSDILVISEAMGQPYGFAEKGGIAMDFKIQTAADVDRLETGAIRERLDYVAQALKLIRGELGDSNALIGFAGSPWTLANYMMEGGSSRSFETAKKLFYTEPNVFHRLMEKITVSVADYLQMQIDTGCVDAVQIFDTQAGLLSDHAYHEASARWTGEIISQLREKSDTPVIVFAKGAAAVRKDLENTGANLISIDWSSSMADFRRSLAPGIGVQGNIDPSFLLTTPETIAAETQRILETMRDLPGHIFNLGHGVMPAAKLECIESLLTTVRNFK
jgi:uroporphyrinogen decarboxylase